MNCENVGCASSFTVACVPMFRSWSFVSILVKYPCSANMIIIAVPASMLRMMLILPACLNAYASHMMQNAAIIASTKYHACQVYASAASDKSAPIPAIMRCFRVPSIIHIMLRKKASDNGMISVVVSVNPAMFCLKK